MTINISLNDEILNYTFRFQLHGIATAPIIYREQVYERKAGGKPSTWLPPGGLVER